MADIRITPAASVMAFTSSLNFIETLTQDASGSVVLTGSGSTGRTNLFAIDGNNGRLFSVDDDLSDSIFSVNTIAGLPVIEAFANNGVNLGKYGAESIVISGSDGSIQLSGSIKAPTLPSTSDTVVVTYNTTTKTLGYNTVAGPSGISGLSGASGRSGISGLSGASGISGLSGASGRSGISGLSGASGRSGISGLSGASGISGLSGASGRSGISGLSGANAGITSYTNPADNRVLTSVSSTTINAEANLTYNGTDLINTITDGYIKAYKDADEYVYLRSLGLIYLGRGTNTLTIDTQPGGVGSGNPPQIASNVNLSISTGGTLAVTGNITATGDITAYASDERLKTDLQPIKNALDKVNTLRAITYIQNEIANEYIGYKSERQAGVIAQDVQKVLPEVVKPAPFDSIIDEKGSITSKTGKNYLTVQYDKLVPLLIASIQELTNKVNNLEEQLKNK